MSFVIRSNEEYRQVLAEIRRLRDSGKAEENRRLADCEAAAASYAEKLRGADLEKGRPEYPPQMTRRARKPDNR